MFGLFKKKKTSSEVAIKTAISLIDFQISELKAGEDISSLINEYCRGYIFGLCDSLLQTLKISEIESIAVMTVIHARLFGEEKGSEILKHSFQEQNSNEFKSGLMKGGQDFVESIKSNNPPMGLLEHLSNNGNSVVKPATKVIACEKCSQKLRVPEGKKLIVKCAKCTNEFQIET